jgi:hypothetical protein
MEATEWDVNQAIDEIFENFSELIIALKHFKKSEWKEAIPVFVSLIREVISQVEGLTHLTGDQKRELAVGILNKIVDIPLLTEKMEATVFGIIIDVSVGFLNNLFGKNWIEKI